MRAKILIVFVALVLGAAAAVATYGYLGAVRREAEAGSRMTEVLVAKQDIPRGASADELIASGAVERMKMPQRYIAQGAISSVRAVSDRILAVPVSKGEMLTTQRFQFPSEAGLSFSVPKGFVAVTLPANETRGLAGLVKPGDRVAVLATVEIDKAGGEKTRITIPGARVLAVGRSTDEGITSPDGQQDQKSGTVLAAQRGTGDQQKMTNLTLALSPADAEKVVFAAEVGDIWLALLPPTESVAGPGLGQTARTVLK